MSANYKVYWNLHKKVWSIVDCNTNTVVQHLPTLLLKNCEFHVQEGGRQRVLRTNQKNVHAYIKGEIVADNVAEEFKSCYYNPYKQSTFTCENEPIFNARYVRFNSNKTIECYK